MSKNIYEAILAVMGEVSYVQKKRAQDSRVGYTLKTENAVIAAVRPAMMKHGIIMYPVDIKDTNHSSFVAGKYENHWNRIVATHVYRFHHAVSDTFVDVAVLGDGADTGDKAGNKSMTVSKKYALLEVFLLETGDDPDETPSPNVSTGGKQKPQPVPASPDGGDKTQMVGVLDAITVQTIVESGLSENSSAAAQVLARFEPKKAPLGKIVDKFRLYREHKTENGDTDAAINHANAKG